MDSSKQTFDGGELLTIAEAAALLKVSKRWLYNRTRLQAVPVHRLGGHLRFCRNELLSWVVSGGGETAVR